MTALERPHRHSLEITVDIGEKAVKLVIDKAKIKSLEGLEGESVLVFSLIGAYEAWAP
jgi:hypothetical protein